MHREKVNNYKITKHVEFTVKAVQLVGKSKGYPKRHCNAN